MSKYAPLRDFLASGGKDYVPMTFSEIEKILRIPLPASKQYPAWWSNNPSNNPMTREWLDAGFETESVNVPGEKLVFRRVRKAAGEGAAMSSDTTAAQQPKKVGFGFMRGLLTVEPGYDLTTPSSELWSDGTVTRIGNSD